MKKVFKPVYDGLPRPYDEGNMQRNETGDKREIVIIEPDVLKEITDTTDPLCIYTCRAACGSNVNAAVWQIQRSTTVGSVITTEWADGDGKFDNIAANRALLTYK
ncbi:MAG TPA: hypothetical protein PLE74_00910 [Candidatus Cloacimonadota bacterium]|nr:hypothetical protein [Candidatus Cloacimonadota bacterium]